MLAKNRGIASFKGVEGVCVTSTKGELEVMKYLGIGLV